MSSRKPPRPTISPSRIARVPELRYEVAALVSGTGERDWRRPLGHAIPGQDLLALGASQVLGVELNGCGDVSIRFRSAGACTPTDIGLSDEHSKTPKNVWADRDILNEI